jgi:hypothetical protein
VEIMQQADALLLPIPQSPGNKLILTGKIFEYLATRRPILSLGPKDGNASAILNKVNNHPMKSYDDFDEISSFLSSIVEQAKKTGQLESVGNDQYQSFSRQGLTESLSDTLDQAIESP